MGDAERRDESGRRISDLDRTVEWVFHELMPEIEQELIEKTDAPPTVPDAGAEDHPEGG